MGDFRDNITIANVECHNSIHDDMVIGDLFVKLNEVSGFNCGERVIVLRYNDFPEVIDVNTISELRKRLESQINSAKRVKELTMKLKSLEEFYKEQLNEIESSYNLKISNLEKEIIRLEEKSK